MATKEQLRAQVVETGSVSDSQAVAKIEAEAKKIAGIATAEAEPEEIEEVREPVAVVEVDEAEDEGEEEQEVEPEPTPKKELTQAAIDRRVARERRRVAEAQAETALLKQRIAELEKKEDGDKVLTPKEIEELAEAKAEQKTNERIYKAAFNGMMGAAAKEYGDQKKFDAACNEFVDDVGDLPRSVIAPMLDMDNGHSILNYLIKNPDEAADLIVMSPTRQVRELANLSLKLEASKKKTISKVPAPITPLGGKQKSTANVAPTDADNDDAWFAKRDATRRARVWK